MLDLIAEHVIAAAHHLSSLLSRRANTTYISPDPEDEVHSNLGLGLPSAHIGPPFLPNAVS
eukprot:scaffold5280_cov90-Skeletonema_dohrnii-CCMP3373.AAC.6